MASQEQPDNGDETSCRQLNGAPPRCEAKSKRTGQRCQAPAMTGKRVCYHHGGATPSGIAHPRYSGARPLKGTTGAHYSAALAQPDLLHMTPDVAVLDARVRELCERMDSGEREGLWDTLTDVVHDAQVDQGKGTLDVQALLARLSELTTKAREKESVWRSLDAAIHSRAKLIDAEMRRQVSAGEMATKAEVTHLLTQAALVIRSRLTDPLPPAELLLSDITTELHALLIHHPATARAVTDAAQEQD